MFYVFNTVASKECDESSPVSEEVLMSDLSDSEATSISSCTTSYSLDEDSDADDQSVEGQVVGLHYSKLEEDKADVHGNTVDVAVTLRAAISASQQSQTNNESSTATSHVQSGNVSIQIIKLHDGYLYRSLCALQVNIVYALQINIIYYECDSTDGKNLLAHVSYYN